MKKKLFLISLMASILMCLLVISVNAGTFGVSDTTANIAVGSVIKDTESQIQMSDGKIYPSYYFFKDQTRGTLIFTNVTKADGSAYSYGDIVKMEIPEGVVNLEDYNFLKNGQNTQLIYVSFPSTLTEITRQAFNGCSKLTSVTIPDSVTKIGPTAFGGCKALTEVIISPTSQLKEISSSAFKNTAIESFYFPDGLTTLGNHVFAYNEGGSLKELVNFENCAVTSIPNGLFRQCGGLKTVKFPKGVTTINGSELFTYCNVETIILPQTLTTFTNKIEASSIGTIVFAANDGTELPANAPTYKTLTYVNYCEEYFNSEHNGVDDGLCTTALACDRCKKELLIAKAAHEYIESMKFDNGFDNYGKYICDCTNEGCVATDIIRELDPIFTPLGYSVKDDGTALMGGFDISTESLNEYNEYAEKNDLPKISYGIIMSNANGIKIENGVLTSDFGIQLKANGNDYSRINYTVANFKAESSLVNLDLVIALYVEDGDEIIILQSETKKSTTEADVNGDSISVNTISLKTVIDLTIEKLTTDIDKTTDASEKQRLQALIDALKVFSIE